LDSLPTTPSADSLVGAIVPTGQRSGAMLFEGIARNWARAPVVMRMMLAAQGITYVHVRQPSQYFTSRPFTTEEAAVAITADPPFKSGVEQGYPALLKEAAAEGLDTRTGFLDGTHIFNAESAPVHRQLLSLQSYRLPPTGRLHRSRGHGRSGSVAHCNRPPVTDCPFTMPRSFVVIR
jgi:hypothetical protein